MMGEEEEKRSFIAAVLGELSRRKVLKTLGAYAVGVFVVLQLMDAAVEPLRLPDWLPTLVVITLILGFPVVFFLAWQFDVTGQGIRRTSDDSLLGQAQTFTLFAVMMAATGAMGLGFYKYYANVLDEPDLQAIAAPAPAGRSFTAPENSIAVLPFADLSEGGDQAHLSDGMAEEILNLLAQVDGLHVAARTSSFAFRNPQQDIREIGRRLNVSTVLEGSLRTAGNRIRMTAQLINVEDGYHIWSETFDRELNDVFELQDEVASAIADALVENFRGLALASPGARPQNIDAFEAYRNGRLHWWRRTPAELQKAIQLFAEALEHDAQYAPAYAAMGDTWILLSLYGNIGPQRAIERAMPMIEKALALDPESAEAYAALGLARMEIGQQDSAESALRQAIALNDTYIPAHLWLSNLLAQTGRIGEQAVVLRGAMAIDPLNELLAINYAGNLNSQGDYKAAEQLLGDLTMVKPDSASLLRTYSGLSLYNGELVKGWELAHRAWRLEPDVPNTVQVMAKAWMELGDYEQSMNLLLDALEDAGQNQELLSQYYQLLLIEGRLEEAESVVRDMFGPKPDELPEIRQRQYHHLLGLIRIVDRDLPAALSEFEQAIDTSEDATFKEDQLFSLTMAAYLHGLVGDEALGQQRLAEAERALNRARINGIDHADIYYTQSVVDLLRDDPEAALADLREAYNRGWRQAWVLEMDGRLDPLRDRPEFIELLEAIEDDLRRARSEVGSLALTMR